MSKTPKEIKLLRPKYKGLYKPEHHHDIYELYEIEEIDCIYCGARNEDPDIFHTCTSCSRINMLFIEDNVLSQVIVPTRADLRFMLEAHHDLKDVQEGLKAFIIATEEGFT